MTNYDASAALAAAESAFQDARWIGLSDRILHSHTMSVFRFSYGVQIEEGSTSAGFLFGGNDARLRSQNRNLQGVSCRQDESYLCLELDIAPLAEGRPALLAARRTGYKPGEQDAVLHTAEIPAEILQPSNAHARHEISVQCVYGEAEIHIDGALLTKGENPWAGNVWNLNPIGAGGDYICYPLLCDIGVRMMPHQCATFYDLEIRHVRKPGNLLYSAWQSGEQCAGGERGYLQLQDPSHGGMTMLQTAFTVRPGVKEARIYATARGIYELYLNGQRVGEDWLTPGLSQYNRTHYYQQYDVTGLLTGGTNQWTACLGEGWWSGAITFSGNKWNYFGDTQSLIAGMEIVYEDGSRDHIVTDPQTWQASQDGPIIYSSLFQGETYDFRKEGSATWQPAEEIPLNEETAYIGTAIVPPFNQKESVLYDHQQYRLQQDRGVRLTRKVPAVAMTEPRPGVYVYDLGQNIAGVPEIEIDGTEGQTIIIRYAEILYPDLPEYADQTGMLMLENIRGALAQDVAILREGHQVIRPHFTYHGYRYMEITGIDQPLPLENVRGLALSSAQVDTTFSCSNPEITRLYQNICWSLMDNFISIPTDCPQRNERMGWSGDLSVFARTALRMCDCEVFLRRQLQALRDTQSEEGRFTDVAPLGGGFGGVLWGSVGITVPWELYLQSGKSEILAEHFDAMCRYARYLRGCLDDRGLIQEGPLGDWLGPENDRNEPQFLWQCYYVYDLHILVRTAEILGAADLREEFLADYTKAREIFHQYYIDPESGMTVYSSEDAARGKLGMPGLPFTPPLREPPVPTSSGRYPMDTQTSYAVALALDVLYPEVVQKAAVHLAQTVRRSNVDDHGTERPPYSLMTGFIGTAWILPALSAYGMDRDAWRMLRQTTYPSWLYPVRQGATTIWERLDSYTLERGFGGNNSMNSFNHYSFGAVGNWMISTALGFSRGETPGSLVLLPTPDPDGEVTWAEGSVVMNGGRYSIRWEHHGDRVTYEFVVPEGQETTLGILQPQDCSLQIANATVLEYRGGRQYYHITAGSYRFDAAWSCHGDEPTVQQEI